MLYNSAQQNDLLGKTIHVKINTAGEIYFVECTEGSPIDASYLPTKVTPVPLDSEKIIASRENVTAVVAPANNKDKEPTPVSSKRKVTDEANVKESSKKPRVAAAATKPTAAAKQQARVDISTPKNTKETAAVSQKTPEAHAKRGGEISTKSPTTTRSQTVAEPSKPVEANRTEIQQDIGQENVTVEKQMKKATTKSEKSKKSDAKGNNE